MKITEIVGYHLRHIPRAPLGNARMFIRTREVLALELKTDEGYSGWGEVFASPWGAAALIKSRFGRLLLGKSPDVFGRHYAQMSEFVGYDNRGHTRLVGMIPAGQLPTLLSDFRLRPAGIQ